MTDEERALNWVRGTSLPTHRIYGYDTQLAELLREVRADERARVVAWLRERAIDGQMGEPFADAIERGEADK